jgi:hypothetical protein
MGLLITRRRPISAVIGGKTFRSLESVSSIVDAVVMHTKEGKPEGSRADGSEYSTLFAQVRPGTVARITAYGADDVAKFNNLHKGDVITADCTPISRDGMGFKLTELLSVTPVPAPAPELVQEQAA